MPEAIDVFGHQFTGYAVHSFIFGAGFCGAVLCAGIVTIFDLISTEFNSDSSTLSDRRREWRPHVVHDDPTKSGDEM